MKKLKVILCCLLMGICGCQKEEVTTEKSLIVKSGQDGYAYLMPYELSEARYWHGNVLSKMDAVEVEKGLERRVQKYFSTSEYLQSAGLLLDAGDVQMLQRRESDDYPYGLNPSIGSFEVSNVLSVESPYLIYDVVELDYYSSKEADELAGVALVILMNSTVTTTEDGQEVSTSISHERLYSYGSNAGRKLERYMRQKNEIEADTPIYIALYAAAESGSSVPGVYIGEGYFTGRSGQFKEINEEWVLVPTSRAEELDGTVYTQFVNIKNSIHDFFPENVDSSALARFENNQIASLKVSINVQAKTYSEINALVQYVASLWNEQDTSEYDLSIEVKMFDKTYFTMVKKQGETEMSIHDIS